MESRSAPRSRAGSAAVVVSAPDGAPVAEATLRGSRLTVGRLADANDVVLGPDPELLVTRAGHCTLEREGTRWFVVDGGGVNGTFLRRGGVLRPVAGRTLLHDGDVVCILGSTEGGGRRYFELAFRDAPDSQATRAVPTERNAAAGDPALCSTEELMHAVWGDEPMHSRVELARLFWELRKKLEPFGAGHLIENERRVGYRLRTCP
jgi:hypothetical protein